MKDVTIMEYVSMDHANVYRDGMANFVQFLDVQMTAMVTVNAKSKIKSGIVFVSQDFLETIVILFKKLCVMTMMIMTKMD